MQSNLNFSTSFDLFHTRCIERSTSHSQQGDFPISLACFWRLIFRVPTIARILFSRYWESYQLSPGSVLCLFWLPIHTALWIRYAFELFQSKSYVSYLNELQNDSRYRFHVRNTGQHLPDLFDNCKHRVGQSGAIVHSTLRTRIYSIDHCTSELRKLDSARSAGWWVDHEDQ